MNERTKEKEHLRKKEEERTNEEETNRNKRKRRNKREKRQVEKQMRKRCRNLYLMYEREEVIGDKTKFL